MRLITGAAHFHTAHRFCSQRAGAANFNDVIHAFAACKFAYLFDQFAFVL